MTGKERITNILQHKPVDRIGLFEHFWSDTYADWRNKGHISEDVTIEDTFGFDMACCWAFDLTADLDYIPETVSETEDTITIKDGNGAILRRHKKHDTTPEHVDFTVKDYESWKEIRDKITFDTRRIRYDAYRKKKQECAEKNRFFCWEGVNVFESIHPVCGHENFMVGMALEPEWIHEMASLYADLTIALWDDLFAKEGKPDGIWFYEDMGYKEHPFMSPEMYREMIIPYHKKTIDYAHSLGLPVIMHSCGFIEPLLPHMIEAGIDCLQVIEIKAGMDLLRIHKLYGDKIALMGGIDVRVLYTNDRALIDKELEAKIPVVKNGYGFVLHSDHSIPKTVDFDTYRYFVEKGLQLGTY